MHARGLRGLGHCAPQPWGSLLVTRSALAPNPSPCASPAELRSPVWGAHPYEWGMPSGKDGQADSQLGQVPNFL